MHKLVLYCILASSLFGPLAHANELNPLRPHRINSCVNDTFSCVSYRDSLSLPTDPVLYVVGTSGSAVQYAESFGRNLRVETPDGELRFYQNVGDAGVKNDDEILFTFTEPRFPRFWHYDGSKRFVILVGSAFPENSSTTLIRFCGQDAGAVQSSNERIRDRLVEHQIETTDRAMTSWFIEEERTVFFGVEGKGWFSLSLNDLTVKQESAEHAMSEGLSHPRTRLPTLVFLSNNPSVVPSSAVREISVDRGISAIQRAFAGLILVNSGDPSGEAVLNELSFSEDEEVRALAEDGLFIISRKGKSDE